MLLARDSRFNIQAGTLIGAAGLDLTPSKNFSFTSSLEKVSVIVYSMAGRLIEQRVVNTEILYGLQVVDNYPSGAFNVIVKQGENKKTIRVVKR